MAHQADFDMLTQRATKGPNKGDYYGLPWPCWGSPEVRHPGTPLLYNTNLAAMDGGGVFRARFGIEREEKRPDGTTVKVSMLADGNASKDSEIKDGYPEFTVGVLKKLGWDKDLTEAEWAVINKVNPASPDAVSWSTDLSGGVQRVGIVGAVPGVLGVPVVEDHLQRRDSTAEASPLGVAVHLLRHERNLVHG